MHWTLRKLVHPPKDFSELYEAGRSEVPMRPSEELEHHSDNKHRFSQSFDSTTTPITRMDRASPNHLGDGPNATGGRRSPPVYGFHSLSFPEAGPSSTSSSASPSSSSTTSAGTEPRRCASNASNSSTSSTESNATTRSRSATMTSSISPDPRIVAEAHNNFPGTNPNPQHTLL